VHVKGEGGERKIAAGDFHLLPRDTPHLETALRQRELITHVTIPASNFAGRSAYVKLRDRASYEFALASAAAALELQGNNIIAARLVLGGVATKPWHSPEGEQVLTGATADEKTFHAAADAALKPAKPYRYNAFKIELAKRAIVRALSSAAQVKAEG